MEKYSEYHIDTDRFEKTMIGMLHMIQTVPIGEKCRIILDYDPALPKASIETFIDKSDVERGELHPQKENADAIEKSNRRFEDLMERYLSSPSQLKF